MSNVVTGLKPEKVFKYFQEISLIPRCSEDEQRISDYLVKFAKDRNLEVIQEECLNVIIKKSATKGYENAKTVILQGHMDMVCVKGENSNHNFDTDPIQLIVDGDFLTANDTTLGADNGIAIAMALAILDSDDLEHPALEMFATVAEETSMGGASLLEPKHLKGEILINIDSEEEGTLLASCAGGVDNIVKLPIEWTNEKLSNHIGYRVTVKGLLGGHSGIEINKNRANAIKLIGRVLKSIKDQNVAVAAIDGGEKMNAITKICSVDIAVNVDRETDVLQTIKDMEAKFEVEFEISDPGVLIEVTKIDAPEKVMFYKTAERLVNILRLIPNGVQTMSSGIEGLVESSTNIGVIATNENEVIMHNAVRSSVKSLKADICERIDIICELNGAEMLLEADYPEWAFTPNSPVRDLMAKIYKDMYGVEVKVDAIHAGLECGFLKEKVGDIDMVSLGPNLAEVHTTGEKMSISSTENVYTYLIEVLKNLK